MARNPTKPSWGSHSYGIKWAETRDEAAAMPTPTTDGLVETTRGNLIIRVARQGRGTAVALEAKEPCAEAEADEAIVRLFFHDDVLPGLRSQMDVIPIIKPGAMTMTEFTVPFERVVKVRVDLLKHLSREEVSVEDQQASG